MTDTLIPLAGLYENTSAKTGKRYFVGYLSKAKVIMLEDTRAEEGQPTWTLFVTERPQKPASTQRPARTAPFLRSGRPMPLSGRRNGATPRAMGDRSMTAWATFDDRRRILSRLYDLRARYQFARCCDTL